jgi:hypothetical protein
VSVEARRLALPLVLVTTGLIVALGLHPVATERILAAYVLALTAIALELATRVLAAASSSPDRSELEAALDRKPPEATRPAELLRTERELTLGIASAGHLHSRLLPLLREAASARLPFDLERAPGRASEALGADVWELLRPDRDAPADRHAPGIPLREVERCVAALERL